MKHQLPLFSLDAKVKASLDLIHKHYRLVEDEGYYLAFSGGKDSVVVKELLLISGLPFSSHYSVTGIDPPDLVYFIRRFHPDVKNERPPIPFLKLLRTKGFPIRQRRWCCHYLKERCGNDRVVITGIRRSESRFRMLRSAIEGDTRRILLHPLLDWSTEDVWNFILDRGLEYCDLYNHGWKRIGCMLCPFSSRSEKRIVLERYPVYVENFRRSFRALHATNRASMKRWKDGDEMFDWWLNLG